MKTIACFGGSNLIGGGYPDGIICADIYPNIIASQGYHVKNYGQAGASAYEIFFACLHQLVQPTLPDIVFIEWNMLARHRFYPSPEVNLGFTGSSVIMPDSWSHCIPLSQKQINNFQETLLLLDGEYHRMITMIKYCEILQDICRVKNVELVMIAGNVSWTPDLFESYNAKSDLGSSLSDYSKKLLDFDNRDDLEILSLLSELKQCFDLLDLKKWIWVFENISTLMVDHAPLDQHPGPKTMKIIADRVIDFLKKKNL